METNFQESFLVGVQFLSEVEILYQLQKEIFNLK